MQSAPTEKSPVTGDLGQMSFTSLGAAFPHTWFRAWVFIVEKLNTF